MAPVVGCAQLFPWVSLPADVCIVDDVFASICRADFSVQSNIRTVDT